MAGLLAASLAGEVDRSLCTARSWIDRFAQSHGKDMGLRGSHATLDLLSNLLYILYYFHLPHSQSLEGIVRRSKQKSDTSAAATATWTAWPRASLLLSHQPYYPTFWGSPSTLHAGRTHLCSLSIFAASAAGSMIRRIDRWMEGRTAWAMMRAQLRCDAPCFTRASPLLVVALHSPTAAGPASKTSRCNRPPFRPSLFLQL